MRERVEVVGDQAPGGPTPVEVRLVGGSCLRAAADVSAPDPDLHRQAERLGVKARALGGPVLGTAGASRLVEAVLGMCDLPDTASLLEWSRPPDDVA
jgi:hypothetical protein